MGGRIQYLSWNKLNTTATIKECLPIYRGSFSARNSGKISGAITRGLKGPKPPPPPTQDMEKMKVKAKMQKLSNENEKKYLINFLDQANQTSAGQ